MEKRGQFYLVAAIIVAAIIIGTVAVANSSTVTQKTNIASLRDQMQLESTRVIDYGINNQLTELQKSNLLQNLSQNYINAYARDDDLYFVFGTVNNITVIGFQNTGNIVTFDNKQVASGQNAAFIYSEKPALTFVTLNINSTSYVFNVNQGENFDFVIVQQTGGEIDVLTG